MLYDSNGIYRGYSDDESDALEHYGTPRHSGRYPWGSGDNPYQRNASFLGKVDSMRKAKGPDGKRLYSEVQIAASMGMKTGELRKRISLANSENRAYLVAEAKKLRAKGMSNSAIGRRMGMNESSVRGLLNEGINDRMTKTQKNAALLKDRVDKLGYIDVGKGSEHFLGLTNTSLNNTLHALEQQGYTLHDIPVEQLGTGKTTTVRVLAKPGTEWKEVMQNRDKIKLVTDVYSEDGGETIRAKEPYTSVDSKRVAVRYAEDGGKDKDGLIELRRGVEDLNLGKARYAQVRILVDGTHYVKGMACYSDDMPDGVDILFNTNKHKDVPMINKEHPKDSVLKPVKEDLENPFGANIKDDEKLAAIDRAQRHYIGADGKEHLSALNIVSEEGTWYGWNKTLPAQFLSKQTPGLAKQQLKAAYDISKAEFDEIASYTNPIVKASLLEDFAGRCETDSVHMAAAALPRQSTRVVLPLTNLRENEIYAPGYRDGEQVALVRFPHGNISEIPICTVNNNNKQAKAMMGDAIDAVGIGSKTAERLSGADFDGDTALVLPMSSARIRNKPQFEGLKDFDPKERYPAYEGMPQMTSRQKGNEMGKITNLITDMTIQGAPDKELCRAIRHSMVVIDAEKHNLNYKLSEQEENIAELKAKYQGGKGTSTLLSRSTGPYNIPERKEKAFSTMSAEEKARYLNGENIYVNTNKKLKLTDFPVSRMTKEERVKWESGDPDQQREVRAAMIADGREKRSEKLKTEWVDKGAYFDPYTLVSGGSRENTTPIERIYADYSVSMKELAREARKMARNQPEWKVDPEARELYSEEVASLKRKIAIAERNAPLERQAQLIANKAMDDILKNNPDLRQDHEHYKREKGRQLDYARKKVGAKKLSIGGSDKNPLTDREWRAIENHAVSKNDLLKILANADKRRIRELAMPRTATGISTAKLAQAKSMLKRGYTQEDVCDALDISRSTLINAVGINNM